jgi:hypothetical protein
MKRCAKIAQLLVEGKKGADLQAAVQEFDKNHVPIIVTRFDTPITARSFRRSVSEPAPDTDPSAPAFLRSDLKASSRRLRATSSQPDMAYPSSPRTPVEEDQLAVDAACSYVSSWSPSCSSVFGSSPFANIGESTDASTDAMWNDMPPLVLPPVTSLDEFATEQAPSLSFNTFVFHESPATCIDSIDPLSPAFDNDQYGSFHAETPVSCSPGPPLTINLDFMDSMDSWSSSPFSSSPCTPISYSGEQFSPVEAVPAPPGLAYDSFNNIMAQLESCGGIGAVLSPAALGSDTLVHLPDLQPKQQHDPYPTSKGFAPSTFQFFSHKLPAPEVPAMVDMTGFTDMFAASAQSFSFGPWPPLLLLLSLDTPPPIHTHNACSSNGVLSLCILL